MKKPVANGDESPKPREFLEIELPRVERSTLPQHLLSNLLIGLSAVATTLLVALAISPYGFALTESGVTFYYHEPRRYHYQYLDGSSINMIPVSPEELRQIKLIPVIVGIAFLGLGLWLRRAEEWNLPLKSIKIEGRQLTVRHLSGKRTKDRIFQIPHFSRATVRSSQDGTEGRYYVPLWYSLQIDTVCSAFGLTLGFSESKSEIETIVDQINDYLEIHGKTDPPDSFQTFCEE